MPAPTGHELLVLAERLVSAAQRMRAALTADGMPPEDAHDEVDRRLDDLLAPIPADVRVEIGRVLAHTEEQLQRIRDGLDE